MGRDRAGNFGTTSVSVIVDTQPPVVTIDQPAADLRDALAVRTGRPVTFGWGPRFLHSTGQYHKGGPATGVYLQVTGDPQADLAVPDRPFTFHEFLTAQAVGDGQVLARKGRPVLRLHVSSPGNLDVVRAALSGQVA